MIEVLERLVAANIQIVPSTELTNHFVFERDGFAALVERRGESFGSIGAPGVLTERGFAVLVWRGEDAWFVSKGWERQATSEEVAGLRSFASDLKAAISGPEASALRPS